MVSSSPCSDTEGQVLLSKSKGFHVYSLLILVSVCFLLISCPAQAANSVTVSLDSVSGTPGGTVIVPIPIESDSLPGPAAIFLNVRYDTDRGTVTDVQAGSSVQIAQKSLSYAVTGSGELRVVVGGVNENVIGDGVLAYVHFKLGAQSTSISMLPSSGSAATPEAESILVTFTAKGIVKPVPGMPASRSLSSVALFVLIAVLALVLINKRKRGFSLFMIFVLCSCYVLAALTAGDVDGSGVVDLTDLQLIVDHALGQSAVPETDLDFSGVTDAVDYQILVRALLDYDIDLDDDGLTDFGEETLGTNINDPDTDGDLIDDGWEHDNGFNPLDVNDGDDDPDNDGMNNRDEYRYGTNPRESNEGFVLINEFLTSNGLGITDEDGETPDWIELYNATNVPVSLNGWTLSDNADLPAKWTFPDISIGPNAYLVVFASNMDRIPTNGDNLHTNFILDPDGEYLALRNASGEVMPFSLFEPEYPVQGRDVSYGSYPGESAFIYFDIPTPGGPNILGNRFGGFVDDTKFSVDRGFYDQPFQLEITTETEGAEIRYTVDGTAPTADHGQVYSGPIPIDSSTIIRAAAFKDGLIPTDVDTQTYIFLDSVLTQTGAGFPATWGVDVWGRPPNRQPTYEPVIADYEMDPRVVTDPLYSPTIRDDLMAAPALSLVMDPVDLFDPDTGLYSNPPERVVDPFHPEWGERWEWEKPGSIELIRHDGVDGFQINCGVRNQGGASRYPISTSKHSFRFLFKSQYGDPKLNYKLFEDTDLEEFNTFTLRGGSNDSWPQNGAGKQYIRDAWHKRTQSAMGYLSPHTRFMHFFVNGLYWGMYNPTERPDGSFAESYIGGKKENYDVIKGGYGAGATIDFIYVVGDGDRVVWDEMMELSELGAETQEKYDALLQYFDLVNFIDYTMINFYSANRDWGNHNFYASRERLPGAKFHFYCWDGDSAFRDVNFDKTTVGAGSKYDYSPARLYLKLKANPEFRLLFADRINKHLFNGGAMTAENTAARYMQLSDEVLRLLVGESARWGDTDTANPLTPQGDWIPERNRILNNFIPQRTAIVLQQFKNQGLWPNLNPPVLNINGTPQHGGYASSGDQLTLTANQGTIYYTTDGTNVRVPASRSYELVPEDADKRILVPSSDIGTAWNTDPAFVDASWNAGQSTVHALKFNGGGSSVNCGTVPGSAPELTAAFWMKSDIFQRSILLDKIGAAATNKGWDFRIMDNGRVQFRIGNKGSLTVLTGTGAYVPDTWVHVAATFQGTSGKLYIDGQIVRTNNSVTRGVDDIATPLQMAKSTAVNTGYVYSGHLRDVQIYDQALGGTEIQNIFSTGASSASPVAHWKLNEVNGDIAHDSSGNGYDGQVVGNPDWVPGQGAVGFGAQTSFQDLISFNVAPEMDGLYTSAYLRMPFTVDQATFDDLEVMKLRVRYDDGFIAYLNGLKVAEANAPATPSWNSSATAANPDAQAVKFETFDLASFITDLQVGDNLLAIHGLNSGLADSDFLMSAELTGGQRSIGANAVEYTTPITLTESMHVKARALAGTEWSALTEATYALGPVAENLRITEIMYHPFGSTPGLPNTEFIEVKNIGAQAINIGLVKFSNGIDFTFPSMTLSPGEYVVVVKDLPTFEAEYGAGINVAGTYTGSLENAGERIQLDDAAGTPILNFRYKDGWYGITDGDGFSLTLIDPANPNLLSWDLKDSWRPSSLAGGSPGADDQGLVPDPGAIVINEILSHSHAVDPDWIELHNTTASPINIGGWFLSDDALDLKKYEIAAGTSIPANGYIVFNEDDHFRNAADPGSTTQFALSENGETVYLRSGLGGDMTGYSDREAFGAAETGIAFGRHLKSTGTYNFVAMSANTPGAANAYPKVGPIVINEIMYNPGATDPNEEFIELLNITSNPVSLYDLEGNPWTFTDGISFEFPANTTIPANGYAIVAKNPAAFAARYTSVPPSVQVFGPYPNKLDNGGERLQLAMPGDLNTQNERQYIRIDRVNYDDDAPWPTTPDGTGQALKRKVAADYGNDVANWQAANPTPGS